MEINVQDIMESIYKKIDSKNLSIAELYGANSYYVSCIERIRQRNDIVIVGAGNYGKKLLQMMELEKINASIELCDNNPKVHGIIISGRKVSSVEEAVKKHPDALFVITPMRYENEIMQQLGNLGITISNILIFTIFYSGLRLE